MSNAMINVVGLTKKFGNFTAVDTISMAINKGEVFGLLGPNGAGKTTTIRMLSCLISSTSGKASIGDYDISNKKDQQRIRKIIGILPENVGLYEDLSAYKNLDFYGRYYKLNSSQRREKIKYYLDWLDLWDKKDVMAGNYSKGMKQKLAIARALIHDPEILFLDEPTANLDPEAARVVLDFLLELKKEQRTIILNTHMLDEAERICDRVGILKTKLIAIDAPKKLRESLHGKKTVVQLKSVNETITSALKQAGPWAFEISDNQILLDVTDPDEENPLIVDAIQSAGGRIQLVNVSTSSLEEVYLNLVAREE